MQSRIVYGGCLTLSERVVQPSCWWLPRNTGLGRLLQQPQPRGTCQGSGVGIEERGKRQQDSFGQLMRRPHSRLFGNCQKEVRLFYKEKRNIQDTLGVFCYVFWPPFAPGVSPIGTTSNKTHIKNKG